MKNSGCQLQTFDVIQYNSIVIARQQQDIAKK